MRKAAAPILIVIGIALIGFAINMHNQNEAGQVKISHAEQQMEHPRPLRPLRDSVARQSNTTTQERIDTGIATISSREELIIWMEIAGVVCVILGIGSLLKGKKKR